MKSVKQAVTAAQQQRARHARVSVAAALAAPTPAASPLQLVRERELRINVLGGIGATTLRRYIADEGFPPGVRLSERIVAWDLAKVRAWLDAREQVSA